MRNCLLCNREVSWQPDISWFFSLKPFTRRLICLECEKNFKKIGGPTCPGCGRPQAGGQLCTDCQYWTRQGRKLLCNRSLYIYNQPAMRDYFKRYKFQGDYRLRQIFGPEFAAFIKKNTKKNDLLVPIPVDDETYQKRRFNQVEGLCPGLELCPCLKMRQKKGRIKQSHKDRHQRLATAQPFYLEEKEKLKGKNVVLLDDIYTTGRTLYHAQSLLEAARAAKVYSLTLAR